MKARAIDGLCDLASSALGGYHGKGSSPAVSEVHCDVMRTIRALGRGELSERKAMLAIRKLRAALFRATGPKGKP